ncbi:MAG TPA: alpha-2-macroglobulin family protein [Polyangiaceae bacterium]|nr:alpha-2-macroglobulin family protein [Polyangiaceae bacterium]
MHRSKHPLVLPEVRVPVTVEFEAEIADVSRRFAIEDTAAALVHPAAFYVGLRPDGVSPRYPGRPIAVEVVAATPEGATHEGAEVTVELVPEAVVGDATTPARARPSPAPERCTVMTGAEPRRCVFTPARDGDYRLRATSVDARGNPVLTALDLQVLPPAVAEWRPPHEPEPEPEVTEPWGDEPSPHRRLSFAEWCQRHPPSAGLDLVRHDQPWRVPSRYDERFDERRWELGDAVGVCIVSPAVAPALVTLERDAILEREVVWLRAGGNLRCVPVTDRLFPHATLRVTSARPLVAGRPASEEVATELWVESGHKALDVSLRLPRRARPGEKLRLGVSVERGGKPTAAQVTLWAVDAGVLALHHYDLPEPFQTFAERLLTPLESSDNRHLLYWPTEYRRRGNPQVRMGATQVGPPGAVPVRERFPAVAWYRPDLRLDASGKATLELPLPDNATRWHVFAVAATRDDAFGGAERTFETSQELLLRPRLPRVSRVGDRLRAAVVLDSTLPQARDVELELRATGALTGRRRATVRLPARGHHELDLELLAGRPGVATFTATARSGALRDAIRIEHRVTEPLTFTTAVVEGVARGVAWERLGSLANARPDAGGLTLTLASSPFAGLGEVARALETYPYGCTEQLVSSLVPSLLLASGGERLGVESGLDRADLERAISTLRSHQQLDGGFGYWTGSEGSDPWLTGYALLALLRARAAGLPVTERAIGAARRFLERRPPDAESTAIDQAWLEDVLATAGAPRRSGPSGGPCSPTPRPSPGSARSGAPSSTPPSPRASPSPARRGRPRCRRPGPTPRRPCARPLATRRSSCARWPSPGPSTRRCRGWSRGCSARAATAATRPRRTGPGRCSRSTRHPARRRPPPPSSPRASGSTARR